MHSLLQLLLLAIKRFLEQQRFRHALLERVVCYRQAPIRFEQFEALILKQLFRLIAGSAFALEPFLQARDEVR